jgi:hypothetical protein
VKVMSKVGKNGRSYKPISLSDLKLLANIAKQDRKHFFQTNNNWAKYYENNVICIALCQGAAKHYIDIKTGINDFDVYTFYKNNPKKHLYAKRIKSFDLGNPKFGQSLDKPEYIGRRVDCLMRSIEINENENIVDAIRRYVIEGKTITSKLLANKAVVLIEPNCGKKIWPK